MSRTIGNIDVNSDTFELWVTRTNDLLTSLATEIITANDATANTGTIAEPRKSQLFGRFGANTLVVTNNLRGGNVADTGSALLYISSNTTIGGNSTVGNSSYFHSYANVLFENANTQVNAQIITVTGNSFIKGNTSVVAINVLGNSTVTNTIVNGTDLFVTTTNTSVNSISIFTGNTFIKANSTITLLEMKGNGTTSNTIMGGNLVQITANVDVTGSRHTIAGNVIFDTTTMFVDSFNNRIGVGTVTPDANLHVVGTANVSGATRMSNTLNVVGAVSLGNTLSVVNAATFANTIAVTGAATLSNTIAVTGAATLSNTIAVTGAATLSNTIAVTGAATLSNTIAVTGAATLSNTIAVTGAATLSNTIAVTGAATLSNTIAVTGAASLGNTLSVVNAATFSNTLSVTGAATFSNTIAVTRAATLSNTIAVTGAATFSNTLSVTGSVTYGNNENYYVDYIITAFANSNLGSDIANPLNVFTFNKSSYSSAKIIAQVKGTTGNTQTSEMVLAHNGTDSYITVYATVVSPPSQDLGDFSTTINGTTVELKFKQNYVSTASKIIATLIK